MYTDRQRIPYARHRDPQRKRPEIQPRTGPAPTWKISAVNKTAQSEMWSRIQGPSATARRHGPQLGVNPCSSTP